MSVTTSFPASTGAGRPLRPALRHVLPRLLSMAAVLALGLVAAEALSGVLDPPGRALRRELHAAAAELHHPVVAQPTAALQTALRRRFREAGVDVDMARRWPNVAVSLRGVTQQDCIDAVREARRIDGPVVVVLDDYRTAEDCHERNYMTWWLLP